MKDAARVRGVVTAASRRASVTSPARQVTNIVPFGSSCVAPHVSCDRAAPTCRSRRDRAARGRQSSVRTKRRARTRLRSSTRCGRCRAAAASAGRTDRALPRDDSARHADAQHVRALRICTIFRRHCRRSIQREPPAAAQRADDVVARHAAVTSFAFTASSHSFSCWSRPATSRCRRRYRCGRRWFPRARRLLIVTRPPAATHCRRPPRPAARMHDIAATSIVDCAAQRVPKAHPDVRSWMPVSTDVESARPGRQSR